MFVVVAICSKLRLLKVKVKVVVGGLLLRDVVLGDGEVELSVLCRGWETILNVIITIVELGISLVLVIHLSIIGICGVFLSDKIIIYFFKWILFLRRILFFHLGSESAWSLNKSIFILCFDFILLESFKTWVLLNILGNFFIAG